MKYKILKAADTETLEKEIEKKLNEGWSLIGELKIISSEKSIESVSISKPTWFIQTMYKKEAIGFPETK